MMRRRRYSNLFLLFGPLVLLSACGASRLRDEAPSAAASAPEPEPATIEQAQAQLERAKAQLDSAAAYSARAAGEAPSPAAPPSQSPSQSQSPAPPPPASSPSSDASESTASGAYKAAEAAPDPCANSCRALSSMRRAVQAICRLAGDSDARCTEARQTLETSEQRVTACRCQ